MSVIKLKGVSVDYYFDNEDAYSIKNAILQFYAKAKKPVAKTYRALNNVSVDIAQGEKIGIIGLNGAGKTTLLRTMAGIFIPTEGAISIRGKVSPLLDFHTGFEEHLTGIENIKIRLMFLGLSRNEAEEILPHIVEFAELGDFIHQPIRTYSAGMAMRLAFATSTSIKPEILIADEVIGTGDAQFAMKAKARLERFLEQDATIILSSHSMDLIHNYCTRVIWLEKGVIIADGCVKDVTRDYQSQKHTT